MTPSRIWIALAVLYAAFFSWYTSCGGPLSDEEIAGYVQAMQESGDRDPTRLALWREFMESDSGDDFAMFNAIELAETPARVDGVPAGESSEQVLARYVQPFMSLAVRSAAHPVLFGSAAAPSLDLWGIEGAERWSNGGVVRYRSRRDVMEQVMALLGDDLDIHKYKIAAMEKTIAYPLDPWFQLGDPRLVLGLFFAALGFAFHALRGGRSAPSGSS